MHRWRLVPYKSLCRQSPQSAKNVPVSVSKREERRLKQPRQKNKTNYFLVGWKHISTLLQGWVTLFKIQFVPAEHRAARLILNMPYEYKRFIFLMVLLGWANLCNVSHFTITSIHGKHNFTVPGSRPSPSEHVQACFWMSIPERLGGRHYTDGKKSIPHFKNDPGE